MKNIIIVFILILSSCGSIDKKFLQMQDSFYREITKMSDQKIAVISNVSRAQHYQRNRNQSTIPTKEWQIKNMENWQYYWVFDGISPTHNLLGDSGNVSYRGLRQNAHIQVIFDRNGNLVTSPENVGTYDFGAVYNNKGKVSKTGLERHFRKDVYPWIYWGNSPRDRTTVNQRLQSLFESIKKSANRDEEMAIISKLFKEQ